MTNTITDTASHIALISPFLANVFLTQPHNRATALNVLVKRCEGTIEADLSLTIREYGLSAMRGE